MILVFTIYLIAAFFIVLPLFSMRSKRIEFKEEYSYLLNVKKWMKVKIESYEAYINYNLSNDYASDSKEEQDFISYNGNVKFDYTYHLNEKIFHSYVTFITTSHDIREKIEDWIELAQKDPKKMHCYVSSSDHDLSLLEKPDLAYLNSIYRERVKLELIFIGVGVIALISAVFINIINHSGYGYLGF